MPCAGNSCRPSFYAPPSVKHFLLSGILALSVFVARAQQPTTQAEYDLVARGLAEQRARGQGPPAGYLLLRPAASTTGQFTLVLEELVRAQDRSLAAIVIQMQHPNWPAPRYLCLPNATSEAAINQQYIAAFSALSPGNMQALVLSLAQRTSTLSAELKR